MANKSNIILRSKLNANKNDFERLRNFGQKIGSKLEEKVKEQDEQLFGIIQTKIESYQGVSSVRGEMKTNIGED
jgi:hypothetical protein